MVNKNEIKKSIIVSTAVLCAGTMLAMSPAQTVSAAVASPTGIAAVVEQAPSASIEVPAQWSTAEVYKNARYGETWGGSVTDANDAVNPSRVYGSTTRWEWLNDKNYVFTVENKITDNGTVLAYQFLSPVDLTGGAAEESYIVRTDENEPIRKYFTVWKDNTLGQGVHLWEGLEKVYAADVRSTRTELGNTHMEVRDDENFYRITYNVTNTYENGYILKGYITYVEVKATGEIYGFEYDECLADYNDVRALTVTYSCIPTQK